MNYGTEKEYEVIAYVHRTGKKERTVNPLGKNQNHLTIQKVQTQNVSQAWTRQHKNTTDMEDIEYNMNIYQI